MVELLARFLPGSTPTGIRSHVCHVRDIPGGQTGHHLLVIGFVVEQLKIDVDVRVRFFKSIHDAQPVDAFRI